MQRSHKIRMYPDKEQETMLKKTAGVARYAYNHTLAEWDRQYKAFSEGQQLERPTAYGLRKQWNATKPDFAKEVFSGASNQAILNLGAGFVNFFRHNAKHPVFKKKGKNKDGFYVNNDKGAYKDQKVRIPNVGWIKLAEPLRFEGKIMAYHVSTYAGQWHVAIDMELDTVAINEPPENICGIDVGLSNPAMSSDGIVLETPGQMKELHRKLKREQKRLSRKKSKSNNNWKQLVKKQKVQNKINNVRTDAVHKFTTGICKNHAVIVVEELDIKGMVKGVKWKVFRRAFQQSMMRELHRQLGYKAKRLLHAPRYYPSTQLCSICGSRKDISLSDRTYNCEHCGYTIDRDFNAAVNLMKIGEVIAESKPVERFV